MTPPIPARIASEIARLMCLTSLPFAEKPTAHYGKSGISSARAARGAPGRGLGRVPKERSSKHLFWGSRPWPHAVGARCPDAPRAARALGSTDAA